MDLSNLDEYTKKRRIVEKNLSSFDFQKYNLMFAIFSKIAELDKIKINFLTNFKYFQYDFFEDHINDIKSILLDFSEKISNLFDIEIAAQHLSDNKKIICILRRLLKNINYNLVIRNNFIRICSVRNS